MGGGFIESQNQQTRSQKTVDSCFMVLFKMYERTYEEKALKSLLSAYVIGVLLSLLTKSWSFYKFVTIAWERLPL